MSAHRENIISATRDVRSRQTVQPILVFTSLIGLICFGGGHVQAQLYDALDAFPPRWILASSDCEARVIEHEHLIDGGVSGRACESMTFVAGHGTEVLCIYPIEPVRAIDDLTANLSVMSAREGCRIGLRVRFPYLRDENTRTPVSTVVYGTSYKNAGEFARIGVGMIERALRLKAIAIRSEYGATADLRDPHVDAIVVNAYSGPGKTSLRLDELNVDGLIPIGLETPAASSPKSDISRPGSANSLRVATESNGGLDRDVRRDARVLRSAFPPGRVTRILQHNGEPLAWVRSLGFDAVLLSSPPTVEVLREAIRARVLIYAPPPTAPDPQLQSLLEPVAAWYLGSDDALDRQHVDQAMLSSRRLRSLPSLWQRPILAAPAESFREYAPLIDALIDDLPIRCRGVSATEEYSDTMRVRREVGGRIESAVGISSMPPRSAVDQVDAIARSIGAPPIDSFRWHGMWLQAIRSLRSSPKAVLFRSSRSLASGLPLDSQRAMALSYVNRMIAMIAPWVAEGNPVPAPSILVASGAEIYDVGKLSSGKTDVLLLNSTAVRGDEVLAGDGTSVEILLSPTDARKAIWRMTHFSAERITPVQTDRGPTLQIVSPDVVEIIVLSSDPGVGGLLSMSASRFARQAGLDRWQLTSDMVQRAQRDWQSAVAARAVSSQPPTDLISIALQTLSEAEPLYRAGDVDASIRMARRADAWALRSDWQLTEALMPDWPSTTSCPPTVCGAAAIQTAWSPLMADAGWGRNRLATGTLDSASMLGENRWSFGQRKNARADSEVQFVTRGAFSGAGALRTIVTPLTDGTLPGGYEGTMVQIRSPSVRVTAGTAIRIDAMVRTIGFGGPHQGLLAYDTIGGQEMGLLLRGQSRWTPVRMYRQALVDGEVNVMFEVIGAGEAMIDEVQLRIWEPHSNPPIRMTPIQIDPSSDLRIGESGDRSAGSVAKGASKNATRPSAAPGPQPASGPSTFR
tara:strand:+ start:765 stop:3677 length:2913 start_codon:yes stop_codon:yes gene_type:complete